MNWMGPISMTWYDENNIPYEDSIVPCRLTPTGWIAKRVYSEYYSTGRIDVTGVEDDPYYALSAPMMLDQSWNNLSDWLTAFSSETLLTSEQLFAAYEEATKDKLIFWKKPDPLNIPFS